MHIVRHKHIRLQEISYNCSTIYVCMESTCQINECVLSGYLFTSMHLSQMATAIGLLRKMEGELEKQHAFI